MRNTRRALVLAAIALAFATGAESAAAAPFDLGAGAASPNVVVDSSGIGYVTFADTSTNQVLEYCRIPAGASACDVTKSFSYGPSVGGPLDTGNSPVLAGSGSIAIIDQRDGVAPFGQRFLFSSLDGGATFSPTTPSASNKVGQLSAGLHGNAVYAPASSYDPLTMTPTIVGIDDGAITAGPEIQATASTGVSTGHFSLSGGASTGASSVGLAGTTLVAAYEDLNGVVHSRRYVGPTGVNADGGWAAPVTVGQAAGAQYRVNVLANGGNPLYVAYPAPSGAAAIARYDGATWGAPVEMTPASVGDKFGAFEDAAGIVHVVYVDSNGSLKYRYARTAANNDFTQPQTIATGGTYTDPKVATSSAGSGFVTWTDGTTNHAAPIAPGEGPAEGGKPVAGDSTGIGGGTTVILKVPGSCVLTGSSLKVSLDVKKKKRHSKKGTKIKAKPISADFYAGGTLVAKGVKKPLEASIPTTGLPAGSKLEVTAKVTVKVKRKGAKAKKKVKTLRSTISIC